MFTVSKLKIKKVKIQVEHPVYSTIFWLMIINYIINVHCSTSNLLHTPSLLIFGGFAPILRLLRNQFTAIGVILKKALSWNNKPFDTQESNLYLIQISQELDNRFRI